jgi:hypothetical protein
MMVAMAWLAGALVFASFFMKTIVPLRSMAIAGNLAFIAYALLGWHEGVFDKVLPILVLHGALLPLNLWRLHEVRRAIRTARRLQSGGPDADLLRPYMQPLRLAAGQTLFRAGEPADKVYVLQSGTLRIVEFDHRVQPGELFGEVGVFRESALRTGTAVCDTDCELMWVPAAKLLELFYQDQRFAFLIAQRLSRYA